MSDEEGEGEGEERVSVWSSNMFSCNDNKI